MTRVVQQGGALLQGWDCGRALLRDRPTFSRPPEPEEIGFGAEYQGIALTLEGRLIGFEAAVEVVELRVLAISIGIDACSHRLALTHYGLSLCIGLSQHFLPLT